MGMFAIQMQRQQAAEQATGALGVNAPEMPMGAMGAPDLMGLEEEPFAEEEEEFDPSQGYAPPVEEVGGFAGMSPMQGLLGMLGQESMNGLGGAMGVGASMGAPTSGGGGGFRASPSGPDFRGPDFNPTNLRSWQGLLGVPKAIRTLATAERQLGLPGLSDAVTGEGFRTRAEQQAAYNRYQAGQGALAAPPGSSFHEQGEAFDISSSWLQANPTAQPWLEKHGFTWDVGGEPWHAHYVGGGQPLRSATGNQGRPITTERSRRGRDTGSSQRRASPLSSYRRR